MTRHHLPAIRAIGVPDQGSEDPSSSFDYAQERCERSGRIPTPLCFGDFASPKACRAAPSKSLS